MSNAPKPVEWVGSSLRDLKAMPRDAQREIGYALDMVQHGKIPNNAKPMKGFGGVSVMEIVENFNTDTYRAIYTVKFRDVVYVLHCFQKKSKSGIATSKQDIDLIKARLQLIRD